MSTKQRPLISVILAVRNAADTITVAIDSVLSQTYAHRELIVIDGLSTDGTLDILKSYGNKIDILVSESDKGAAEAINKGLRIAKGTLITTLFSDDFYEAGIFEAVANQYDKTPEADIISTGCRVMTLQPKPKIITEQKVTSLSFSRFINSQPFVGCRFFNRSVFNNGKLFPSHDVDGHYNYANDTTFMMQLFLQNAIEVIVPFIGYTYISSPGSTTYADNPDISIRCYIEEIRTIDLALLQANKPKIRHQLALNIMKQDRIFRLYRLYKSKDMKSASIECQKLACKKPVLSTIALAHLLLHASIKRIKLMTDMPLSDQLLHSIGSLTTKHHDKIEKYR